MPPAISRGAKLFIRRKPKGSAEMAESPQPLGGIRVPTGVRQREGRTNDCNFTGKERPTAMKKLLLVAAASAMLSMPAAFAQRIVVREAPPPVLVEHPGPRPHAGWVWVPGYHRWDGRHYVWMGGRWAAPPRPYARWVPGHWRRSPQGWVWIEGHWRG